jgi:hypothetical protein
MNVLVIIQNGWNLLDSVIKLRLWLSYTLTGEIQDDGKK